MNVTTEFDKTTDLTRYKEGKVDVEVEKVQKDYFQVRINGFILGVFERSQIRQMVGDFDNAID